MKTSTTLPKNRIKVNRKVTNRDLLSIMSMLFVLVPKTKSMPSSVIYPRRRNGLIAPSLVVPSFAFKMLYALFNFPKNTFKKTEKEYLQ